MTIKEEIQNMMDILTIEKERNEKFIKGWWAVGDADARENDISNYLRKVNEFTKICAQLEILEELTDLLNES